MELFSQYELESFRGIIESRLGLHFDPNRMDVVAEVLRERLMARGKVNAARYLAGLPSEREELRKLAALLTVTETYFFRVPEHFRVLAEVAIPARLAAVKSARPLRILSAGCASGDEAYSAAIVLREQFPELTEFTIVGLDVNSSMLERAAEACYGPWSLREIREDLRQHYFSRQGRNFLLSPSIRRMATFEERNLGVENGTPWAFEPFDIVFCRNTIMYMVPEAARRTVARLTEALVTGGFLFLSHAETLRGLSQDFHLCHTHDTFYYQKREDARRAAEVEKIESRPIEPVDLSWADSIRDASEHIDKLSRGAPFEGARVCGKHQRASVELGSAVDLLRQERFQEALDAVHQLPSEIAVDPDALLLRAVLLANCGDMTAAEQACQELLQSDDLNASAQYVTALCREHAGDYSGAVEHDRVAVYLDPTFAMPHLHLGVLAKRLGDLAAARAEMEQASALLEREDASRILLLGGGFSRQALLEFSRGEWTASGGHR